MLHIYIYITKETLLFMLVQCAYIHVSSRICCNECTMLPCMLAFLHVSLGCRRLTVCCCRIVCLARVHCLVHAHVLKLAACFSFHLWPLKQPCACCLDVFRDFLGSENMPIMPSQVSLSLRQHFQASMQHKRMDLLFAFVRMVKVHYAVK